MWTEKKWVFIILIFCFLSFPQKLWAVNEVENLESLRKQFGLQAFSPSKNSIRDLKIAILDNGFVGFQPGNGMLPESAELKNLTAIGAAPTHHGLGMAQIVWAMTGKSPEGPKFFLVNTNGFSNLKAAIQFVIDEKVDLVLYSQVWPFGSNFDGTGFINEQVTRAVQSGVIWVNAAGNHGGMVYNGFVEKQRGVGDNQFLTFNSKDFLRFENKLDENQVALTLSWSDFKESDTYNTHKDLDLFVYDSAGKLVDSSELIQRGEAPPETGGSKLSSHAREVVTLKNLDRGQYQIKIKVNSNHFDANDRFRVLIKAEKESALVFTDRTLGSEIQPPADHPGVITVGEKKASSAAGPTADGRVKPEILIDDARVSFTNGTQVEGTSVAAALFAGIASVLKAQESLLSFEKLKKLVERLGPPVSSPDLIEIEPIQADFSVTRFIPPGGKIMKHRLERRYVILSPGDPYDLPEPKALRLRRVRAEDVLVVSPHDGRWMSIPGSLRARVKYPWVEFRSLASGAQMPTQSVIWRTPTPAEFRNLF